MNRRGDKIKKEEKNEERNGKRGKKIKEQKRKGRKKRREDRIREFQVRDEIRIKEKIIDKNRRVEKRR